MSFFGGEHFKCQTVAVLKFWQGLSIGILGATAQYIPSYITDFIQSVCCAAAAAAVTKSHYFAWKMALICTTHQEITALVSKITEFYMANIAVHFCKIQHRGVICTNGASLLHKGEHPQIQVVYISSDLKAAAKVIIRNLKDIFKPEFEAGDDGLDGINVQHPEQRRMGNILMCPGCGASFSSQ